MQRIRTACLLAVATLIAPAVVSAEEMKADAIGSGIVFRDCDQCPEMVVVLAGEFVMGSPPGEAGRMNTEGPQHAVTIAAPFAAGKYEVTFEEWDACVADGGCDGYRPDDAGWGRGRRPVINVSWRDAEAYAAWLSSKTGHDYRLPSEAEWEYAARAGTTTPFWTGQTISDTQANFSLRQSAEVGAYPPNPWGLHEMNGNVAEFVGGVLSASLHELS